MEFSVLSLFNEVELVKILFPRLARPYPLSQRRTGLNFIDDEAWKLSGEHSTSNFSRDIYYIFVWDHGGSEKSWRNGGEEKN